MTGFSPDWLALREPADHRARNPELLARVKERFTGRDSVMIVDLGSGTASNLRGLAPVLPDHQHWTLVDYDENLLEAAGHRLVAWAESASEHGEELVLEKDGKRITVDRRRHDLVADIDTVLGWKPDLVTAAALFDLVSPDFIARFADGCARHGLAFHTVLTYDGTEEWSPRHLLDAGIHAAFLAHQAGDKGFGASAGPGATQALLEAFEALGFTVLQARSDWEIGDADGALVAQLASGIADAAAQTGRLTAQETAEWARARAAPGTTARIGHLDLLALPGA